MPSVTLHPPGTVVLGGERLVGGIDRAVRVGTIRTGNGQTASLFTDTDFSPG